jgi:hypothetical protein
MTLLIWVNNKFYHVERFNKEKEMPCNILPQHKQTTLLSLRELRKQNEKTRNFVKITKT